MKKNSIFVIFLLLLFLICISNAAASEEMDSNINSINDNSSVEAISNSNSDNPKLLDSEEIVVDDWNDLKYYCSLSDKNYQLKLKENTNYYPSDTADDNYQIVIRNNVTIRGSADSYIGDNSSDPRIIKYMPIKVSDKSGIGITLENITFKWINTKYQDSGVFITLGGDANNTIRNCYFTGITTNVGHSSIIHIKYGDLLVDNCSFINCTTDYGCISVYCPDDKVGNVFTSARMYVRDSYFEGNYAKTEPGCINNCGLLIVNNTVFHRNSAFWWAGAIHTHSSANTTVYNSNFTDNVAGWNGGALYTYSYLQIYNCSFIGNNCTTNNGGGAIGAWNYGHAPFLHIEDCLFEYNENLCWGLDDLSTSGTGRGGAISFPGSGALEVLNSTFIKNSASIGTAISVESSQNALPLIKIIDNQFINHTRFGDVLKINCNLLNCEISGNYYYNNSIVFSKLRLSNDDPVNGTVTFHIDAELDSPQSYDEDILDNSEYYVFVDGVYKATVHDKTFTMDFKTIGIAHVYIVPSISNSRSNEVLAGASKTYIYLSQRYGADTNDGLTRDTPVKTLNKSIELARAHGNIIIMDGAFNEKDLIIDYNLTIKGESNVSISSQGNIFTINSGDVSFTNIIFKKSKLSQSGAARERIIKQLNNGYLLLDSCTFESNQYRALIESEGYVEAYNLKFFDNYASLIKANSLKLSYSYFEGNSANRTNYLSLLQVKSTGQISYSSFKDNLVRNGCIEVVSGTTSVDYCNFTGNRVLENDGASCIHNGGGSVTVSSSIMMNNIALASKSSIIHVSSGTTGIRDSIILNNSYTGSSIIVGSNSALSSTICNNNWWGNTLENLAKPQLDSSIKCSNWRVLNASSSKEYLVYVDNEQATISFDLNYLIDKNNNVEYCGINLPAISLKLVIVNGKYYYNHVDLLYSRAEIPFELRDFKDGLVKAIFSNIATTVQLHPIKKDPNFNVEVNNITIGESVNITVTTDLNITDFDILVDEEVQTLHFTNGVGTILLSGLSKGLHDVNLTFLETENYASCNIYKVFEVYGVDPNMTIDLNNSYYGDDVRIVIRLPDDAEGTISVSIGNQVQNKSVAANDIEFIFSNLNAGSYDVLINYSGDNKYSSVNITSGLTVFKHNSSGYLVVGDVVVGQDVVLTLYLLHEETGNVTFIVNNRLETVDVNDSKAIFTIRNIKKGDYQVKAIYNGDNKYLSFENSTRFTVDMLNSTVNVTVEDIVYGQNATFRIHVSEGATGNVTIIVDNQNKSGKLVNSNVDIDISGLSAGNKNVTVIYEGDENYLSSENSTTFAISKAAPLFNISVSSNMVGQKMILYIDFDGKMTGNFTIRLLNVTANRKILSQNVEWELPFLNPGDYSINVTYNGDDNFETGRHSSAFSIFEYHHPQLSNDGVDTKNTDKSQFEVISNGEVLFALDFKEKISGNIVIDNEGNFYFASDTTLFAYSKNGDLLWNYSPANMGDNSFSGLAMGRNILIAPMSGDTLYFINITNGKLIHSIYQGSSLFAPVIDDNYTIYISSERQVNSGDYYLVMIPYENWMSNSPVLFSTGKSKPVSSPIVLDGNHVGVPTEDGLKIIDIANNNMVANINYVSKMHRPVAGFGGFAYVFGENSIISITPEGNKLWETIITGGKGNYISFDSDSGYLYSVNANGVLYKYDIQDGEELFVHDFKENMSSNILIDNAGNLYVGSENGMFYALNCDGDMLWKVNLDESVIANPVVDEEGFIYVILNSSRIVKLIHNSELSDSNLNAKIDNITVGDDLSVNITFDGELTGDITLKINNGIYNVTSISNENHLELAVSNLAVDDYLCEIIYSGDYRFKPTTIRLNFSVLQKKSTLNITAPNEITIGQNATIEVILPEGATGNIKMTYDNMTQMIPVKNARAIVNVSNDKAGIYNITFKYEGNVNFTSCENVTSILVSKVKIPDEYIAITFSQSNNVLTYLINLTDVTGNLLVYMDGTLYKSVELHSGKATVEISTLSAGKHNIEAIYSGNDKYQLISKSIVVNVPVIKLTGSDVNMLYTSGAKYSIRLASDGSPLAGKTVTFIINGKQTTATTDNNGYASVKIDLPPKSGYYAVSAEYQGVKVSNKVKVNSILSAKNMKVKKSAKTLKIKVTLKKVNGKYLKSKKLTLKLNGKKYTAKTNNKGVATFKITKKAIKKLKAGKKYTYQATYLKDIIKKSISVKK